MVRKGWPGHLKSPRLQQFPFSGTEKFFFCPEFVKNDAKMILSEFLWVRGEFWTQGHAGKFLGLNHNNSPKLLKLTF